MPAALGEMSMAGCDASVVTPAASSAVHGDAPGGQVLFGRERKPFVRQPNHPARRKRPRSSRRPPGPALAKSSFFGDLICPGWNIMFAPQKTHKSIFKIHQVMVRSLTGLASSSLPEFIATGTLVSRGRSPHNDNIPKTRTNIIGQ
ncbi:MAG: hypothetical protein CM1200mP29_01650 [Verrucomicrobiota bacterium]|nr:MAG: hypothetical protein CM1200mP29_01650 [Verrucomicrobiota bacterium]